jgi:hypothetical protein
MNLYASLMSVPGAPRTAAPIFPKPPRRASPEARRHPDLFSPDLFRDRNQPVLQNPATCPR